jgi:putative spermidine/putrescine transport system permease protein
MEKTQSILLHYKTREQLMTVLLAIITGSFVLYQWLPMLTMFLLSFTGPEGGSTFPMKGVSLHWYRELLKFSQVDDFKWPMLRSTVVALASATVTGILALTTAIAFRTPFRGANIVFYFILLGIAAPGILVGFGMAVTSRILGIPLAWYSTTFLVHVVWTLPFGFLVMLAVFNRFDRSLEEAALTLKANRWKTFTRVTLPLILHGVVGAFLFGFTLSYDEFARSILATGVDMTLPIFLFAQLDKQIKPTLYALGAATTLFSFVMIGACALVYRVVLQRRKTKTRAL